MKNPYTRSAERSVLFSEYASLDKGAALVDLSHRTILRLTDQKAIGMLNAVLTNEVSEEDDRGVYALLLNPKGRIQADLRVLKYDEGVLIDTEPEAAASAKELLGRYAPFYRVEVEDLSAADIPWGVLGLYGPRAKELLDGLELGEHETTGVKLGGTELLAAGVEAPVPGYDLIGPEDALSAAREHLRGRGAAQVGLPAYETARIAAGIPRFGSDITPDNFPAEAGILERAVSFEKGCYPGQETVARMHYRGHPNKKLYRFELEPNPAEPTAAGDEILQGEKKVVGPVSTLEVVGWISSVAPIPVGGRVLALGYLSRKADPDAPMRAEDAMILESKPAMESP